VENLSVLGQRDEREEEEELLALTMEEVDTSQGV